MYCVRATWDLPDAGSPVSSIKCPSRNPPRSSLSRLQLANKLVATGPVAFQQRTARQQQFTGQHFPLSRTATCCIQTAEKQDVKIAHELELHSWGYMLPYMYGQQQACMHSHAPMANAHPSGWQERMQFWLQYAMPASHPECHLISARYASLHEH